MGRKRTTELKVGGKTTLYIPQDIDPNVLEFFKEQKNLSKTLIEIAYLYVHSGLPTTSSPWMGSLAQGKSIKSQDPNQESKIEVQSIDDPEPVENKNDRKANALRSMLNTDSLG